MDATIRLTHEGFKWRRTPEGVENVARDKLDMAAEGEIIFYDVSD